MFSNLQKYLNQGSLNMENEDDRHFILQIALKCADISNPCRPWEISRKWSQKVCEEFFRQGDYEQQLGLPLTALCDRSNSSVPKIQSGKSFSYYHHCDIYYLTFVTIFSSFSTNSTV